eukprot:7021902-Heterocapsa_arctica.AAC.1
MRFSAYLRTTHAACNARAKTTPGHDVVSCRCHHRCHHAYGPKRHNSMFPDIPRVNIALVLEPLGGGLLVQQPDNQKRRVGATEVAISRCVLTS